uniref:Uncharacterized protein n=1 Tax=Ditylenchus dipsaci TaxID=166011 RepID=A0A915E0S0_9BILA
MTTAHRPTFNPAQGGTGRNEGDLSKLSQQYSSRDMPSHTKLKYRQKGQAHPDEVMTKDLRRDVEDRELNSKDRRSRDSSSSGITAKKPKLDALPPANLDADDPQDADDDLSDSDQDSDDDADLMAELERIKKERAAERVAKERREAEEQERIRQDNILHGNPLLTADSSADFKVKRRWDDDVIFKNCARGLDERKKEPTFINDAIRSEFHKKFMEKYIK